MYKLIWLFLIMPLLVSSCKKHCDGDDLSRCRNELVGTSSGTITSNCDCSCGNSWLELYTSPIDKQKFCFNYNVNASKGADREVYLYDHSHISRDGVKERLAGPVFCYFNEIAVSDKAVEFPDQGGLVIRSLSAHPDDCMEHYAWQSIPFYLKNGNRDTLFFDQPRDFFDAKYWMCHNYSYIKGFAVRKSDRLEWHFGLYDFQYKTPFDRQLMLTDMTYDFIFPDTLMAITTMRVR
jgi:hypothetical protein